MTPAKEKAEELFQKYYNNYGYYGIPVDAIKNSKQCALIAVDEILEVAKKTKSSQLILRCGDDIIQYSETFYSRYWTEVKKEIEKL
jgi:hypothetical protein